MNEVWKKVKEYAKTIAVFVFGVVSGMIINLMNEGTVWPANKEEWIRFVVNSFGSAIAALLVRNKITQKQLDKDPYVIGGTVVDTAVKTPATDINDTPPPTPGLGGYSNTGDWPKP